MKYETYQKNGRALIRLKELLTLLQLPTAEYWVLQDLWIIGGERLFGVSHEEAESASRLPSGVRVSDGDMQSFMGHNYQIIDGVIEAWSECCGGRLCTLECIDSTLWEVSTELPELNQRIAGLDGFTRVEEP